ncbi:MAG: hypothetical protein LBS46_03390 [Dysgonamonadaceae bacterium]|jgi:hypothetical protein|nr:hypothetical protein [Dysgonamonadaceae bacterium]
MKYIALLAGAWIGSMSPADAAIRYVKEGGTGDGSSWVKASGNLQAVINSAASLDKIFVAAGTYRPAIGTAFTLGGKVLYIYGAFAGNETSATPPSVPDTTRYKTILQGNGNRVVHAYYKATAGDGKVDDNLIIQGCRIEGGSTNGMGAGLYIKTGTVGYCSIANNTSTHNHGGGLWFEKCTLKNSIIADNTASLDGGGLYAYVSVTMSHCLLTHNTAQGKGGALFSHNVAKIDNTRFEYNRAVGTGGGGGIHAAGSTDPSTITDCIISHNVSEGQAGGIYLGKKTRLSNSLIQSNTAYYDGGGIRADSENRAEIYGCIIEDNEATNGAGGGVALNKSTMANCLIAFNRAGGLGGGIRLTGASATTGLKAYAFNLTVVNNSASAHGGVSANANGVFQNGIAWNNTTTEGTPSNVGGSTASYSLFPEAVMTDGNHNSSSNPLFVDAGGDFRLSPLSPAIDTGAAVSGLPAGQAVPLTDLDGKARTTGASIDRGAYEYSPSTGMDWVDVGQDKIGSAGKTLFVQAQTAGELSVYSVSGALYSRQFVAKGKTVNLYLPAGIYVVKLDSRIYKTVIR